MYIYIYIYPCLLLYVHIYVCIYIYTHVIMVTPIIYIIHLYTMFTPIVDVEAPLCIPITIPMIIPVASRHPRFATPATPWKIPPIRSIYGWCSHEKWRYSIVRDGGFHNFGAPPIAGWFISWKIPSINGWFGGKPPDIAMFDVPQTRSWL